MTYETAGALQGGRKVWMLARMPHRYIIAGDEIAPYLVVMNSHDGSSGIKVAMTPIRVVCQNTLNLALDSAKRIWTTKHTENVMLRVHEAEETLGLAEKYMSELGRGIDTLSRIRLTNKKVMEFMAEFFPVTLDMPDVQRKNNLRPSGENALFSLGGRSDPCGAVGLCREEQPSDRGSLQTKDRHRGGRGGRGLLTSGRKQSFCWRKRERITDEKESGGRNVRRCGFVGGGLAFKGTGI